MNRLYLLGGVALAVALLVGYGKWQAHRADLAMEKLEAVSSQLTALQAGVSASNEAIARLDLAMGQVARKAVTIRERVITMERNDAQVRAFLDTPAPPDGCLLDDTCATGSPLRSAPAPMRPASATGEP
jgi:hypothetical protein